MGESDDRAAIVEACSSVGWLADRRRWEELQAVFAPRVDLDYTSLNGGEPARLEAGEIVAGWREAFAAMTATQHLIATHLVEIDGDRATCTANFQRPTSARRPTATRSGGWVATICSGWSAPTADGGSIR